MRGGPYRIKRESQKRSSGLCINASDVITSDACEQPSILTMTCSRRPRAGSRAENDGWKDDFRLAGRHSRSLTSGEAISGRFYVLPKRGGVVTPELVNRLAEDKPGNTKLRALFDLSTLVAFLDADHIHKRGRTSGGRGIEQAAGHHVRLPRTASFGSYRNRLSLPDFDWPSIPPFKPKNANNGSRLLAR